MIEVGEEFEGVTFRLDYDDVAMYLFDSLIRLGYAPAEDEILDLTDVVTDLFLSLHQQMGGEVIITSDDELEE